MSQQPPDASAPAPVVLSRDTVSFEAVVGFWLRRAGDDYRWSALHDRDGQRWMTSRHGTFGPVEDVEERWPGDGTGHLLWVRRSDGWSLLIDGRALGPFDAIPEDVDEAPGGHFAFVGKRGARCLVVVDGEVVADVEDVGAPDRAQGVVRLAADPHRYVYTARADATWRVHTAVWSSEPCQEAQGPFRLEDRSGWYVDVRRGDAWYVVGARGEVGPFHERPMTFAPRTGDRLVVVGDGRVVTTDGATYGPFLDVGAPGLSRDGGRVLFKARRAEGWFIVGLAVDLGPYAAASDVSVAADAGTWAAWVDDGSAWRLVGSELDVHLPAVEPQDMAPCVSDEGLVCAVFNARQADGGLATFVHLPASGESLGPFDRATVDQDGTGRLLVTAERDGYLEVMRHPERWGPWGPFDQMALATARGGSSWCSIAWRGSALFLFRGGLAFGPFGPFHPAGRARLTSDEAHVHCQPVGPTGKWLVVDATVRGPFLEVGAPLPGVTPWRAVSVDAAGTWIESSGVRVGPFDDVMRSPHTSASGPSLFLVQRAGEWFVLGDRIERPAGRVVGALGDDRGLTVARLEEGELTLERWRPHDVLA